MVRSPFQMQSPVRPPSTGLSVTLHPVPPGRIGDWEREWRALEAHAPDAAPYLLWDWIAAWAEVYRPPRLAVVRVAGGGGETVAIALLHLQLPRVWRFAGAPVSSERGLLCADGRHEDAWTALMHWLAGNPRAWAMLDGQGLLLPWRLRLARTTPMPVLGMRLPQSFDAYLAANDPKMAARTRKRVRRLERSGAAVRPVPRGDLPAALNDLVRLHTDRARSKGERHPEVDDRLARLLERIAESERIRLHAFELIVDGRRAGITVRIDHGATAYSYNDGLDPGHMSLSPGILLELESIRDAIDRGLGRYDLGPGDYPYKRELGAVAEERVSFRIVAPNLAGRTALAAISAYRGLRGGLRRAAIAVTGRRHSALVLGLYEPALAL